MAKYYLATCTWKDDDSEFEAMFKDSHDVIEEEDDDIFYYGLSEEDMLASMKDGSEDILDFRIESFEEFEYTPNYTYDIHFNDDNDSNNKGWKASLEDCLDYIDMWNGTNESYFADYKGGIVSVVRSDGEIVTEIKIN